MRWIILAAMMSGAGSAASADPALGVWQTGPDRKGQIAHVEVTRCAEALCGRIIRAYSAEGHEITTPNVGKRVFWDMTPAGTDRYSGRAWVPAHDREYAATMLLEGNRLKVSGCVGPICQSQVWARPN
ncbi:Uncharacterized conserved protein, DUF2147 family [Roseovarius azorensis]|uniref:Uncharacterized conserved protein, DUF2147 family n=1 Tax=Roseovarius azorensis TaxID=1287727 RepID=A0A1H7GS26_9RHOB|nr:DUF2147 domain-containing protein [Roseovarius azorensis]SEK39802.1 Uncharacterized conserved protein, DUF2147 family [Roseovarius azorensis]